VILDDAECCTFDPPPVKIRGGVGEISIQIVEAIYDRISEIHLMAIHCAAAEHGRLIKEDKKFVSKT